MNLETIDRRRTDSLHGTVGVRHQPNGCGETRRRTTAGLYSKTRPILITHARCNRFSCGEQKSFVSWIASQHGRPNIYVFPTKTD